MRLRVMLLILSACSKGDSNSGVTSGPSGLATFTITPAEPKVLTCGTQQFTVDDTATTPGAWSTAAGSVNATGLYSAPTAASGSIDTTVTYTPANGVAANATVHYATAFVGAPVTVDATTSAVQDAPFDNIFVASGQKVYSVYLENDNHPGNFRVAASNDGGKTFAAPIVHDGGGATFNCVTAAVDAGNSDVLYIVYHGTLTNSHTAVNLIVSTDGGKSIGSQYVIEDSITGTFAEALCPSVTSPSADHVIVALGREAIEPNRSWAGAFVSANRGADFGAAATSNGTGAGPFISATDKNMAAIASGGVGSNGGQKGPRVFSDGKGHACMTYSAESGIANCTETNCNDLYVQCSSDNGNTWSAINKYAATGDTRPVGAFSKNGKVALAWMEYPTMQGSNNEVMLAISSDFGATFGTKKTYPLNRAFYGSAEIETSEPNVAWQGDILWLAQTIDPSNRPVIAIDKSCDFGNTWSGTVAATNISDYTRTALVVTSTGVAVGSAYQNHSTQKPFSLFSLTP